MALKTDLVAKRSAASAMPLNDLVISKHNKIQTNKHAGRNHHSSLAAPSAIVAKSPRVLAECA